MFLSLCRGTFEPKCVCIAHLPRVCVIVCPCICVFVCVHFPVPYSPLLPPGGRGPSAQRPVSSRTPSSSPLSARQLGSGLCGTPGCRGLTFTPNPSPLRCPGDSYASDPSAAYSFLSSVHAWPGCCVTSQVQVPGQARPSRARPGHCRPDWPGGGWGANVWLLIFHRGSGRDGGLVFWWWAGVIH